MARHPVQWPGRFPLEIAAYREVATIAIASLVPLGSPQGLDQNFIPGVKAVQRSLARDPISTASLDCFTEVLSEVIRRAFVKVGYDDAVILETVKKAIPQ